VLRPVQAAGTEVCRDNLEEHSVSDTTLDCTHVYKKFRRGELHDSLRDLIPAISRRLLNRKTNGKPLKRAEFWALDDISFSTRRGEALGIIGDNGAGKSTILKLLTGVLQPTRGKIGVYARLSALIEVGAGFHPDLTGRENIYLNGTILGMKRQEIKRKFDEIVDFSGIKDFIDTPVKRYSSGMYARLGFSVAAHVDPDILVVDEVLSVGDYAFQNKCLAKMKSILQAGATVIFVSHNLRAVSEMCSRCLWLDRGRLVMEGSANDVVQQYITRAQEGMHGNSETDVFISNASFRGSSEESLIFRPGQNVFFEVEITARKKSSDLSVSLALYDSNFYRIFDTSTQRLDHDSISLDQGGKRLITFALELHLAPGTYYFASYIYRYDLEIMYDQRIPAATIYISSEKDTRGVVNLYPEVTIE
jgi:lipopolysaccharide transport system ATP-binding protein